MELKFDVDIANRVAFAGSNRTFMELKFALQRAKRKVID